MDTRESPQETPEIAERKYLEQVRKSLVQAQTFALEGRLCSARDMVTVAAELTRASRSRRVLMVYTVGQELVQLTLEAGEAARERVRQEGGQCDCEVVRIEGDAAPVQAWDVFDEREIPF